MSVEDRDYLVFMLKVERIRMMSNVINQINQDELEQLAIELIDYADDIGDLFNQINQKMSLINSYLSGDSLAQINNNYSFFKNNFKIAKENILSYSNDLIALIQKMKDGQLDLAKLFVSEADNINLMSQKIERL